MSGPTRFTGARERRALDTAMVRGMGLVASFAFISAVARLGQDAAIAWRFGTGATVDAYYFLVSVGNWPVAVVLSVLTVLMAPTEATLRQSGPQAALRFRSELLGAMLATALVMLPLMLWLLDRFATGQAGGLGAAAAAQAQSGTVAFAVVIALGLVGALLSAWLVASGQPVLALLEGLPALVLCALVLLLPGPVLFWGTAAGVLVQVVAMAWVLRRSGALPWPRVGFAAMHWRGFSEGVWLLVGAQVLFALVPLVDSFLAARLGEGAVSSLGYANRLVLGLQGLGGLALQRAGLPLFSRVCANSSDAARPLALRWAAAAAAAGVVLAAAVAIFAEPLLEVIFEHGRFSAADRAQVATLLRYGVLQLPMFFSALVLVTALAAANARRALAAIAVVNTAVKLLASFALVPMFGLKGLLLATALMYGSGVLGTCFALRRHYPAAMPSSSTPLP